MPSPALAEYVRSYEYSESLALEAAKHPFAVSVFPLLTFFLGEPVRAFEYAPRQMRTLPRAIVVGPCDHRVAEVVRVGHLVHFTVAFQPTGFFRLFGVSPWDVRNLAYDCRDVLGERVGGLHARLRDATCPEQMVAVVEEVLLQACMRASPRSSMQWAADALLKSKGRVDLLALADSLGLSDSSWRRHFSCEIGVTPKRYLRMLRFRHAIASKRARPERHWTQICLDAGYYDQAHFIADCQALVGCAPSRFMRELAAVPRAPASLGAVPPSSRARWRSIYTSPNSAYPIRE